MTLPEGTPLGDFVCSASQIKNFRKCPRKWAFDKLAKLPRVENVALLFGTRMHAFAADWLANGTPPDLSPEGRVFAEGIPLLPRPGSCLVEQEFRFNRDGIEFVAILDVVTLDPIGVIDHKSTSGRQWSLSAEALASDEQAILYASVVLEKFDLARAPLRWVYYPKRGGTAWPVDITLARGDVDRLEPAIVADAHIMRAYREGGARSIDWCNANVPCRLDGCDGIGRFCDAAAVCTLE